MSGKIIDLDPNRRLTKESLEIVKEHFSKLTIENTETIACLYINNEGTATFETFGVDWAALGILEAYLEDMRHQMLYPDDGND